MKYKDQTNEVKQIIIDLANEAKYESTIDEIDYKFWEDCSHEETAIILAQRLVTANKVIQEQQAEIDKMIKLIYNQNQQ